MTISVQLGGWASLGSCGYFALGYTAPSTGVAIEDENQVFLRAFGEQVTYRPLGGVPRTILAVVDRQPPAPVEGPAEPAMGKRIVIHVANSASSIAEDEFGGIGVDELDTGGDQVDLPVRLGQTAQTRQLTQLIQQDGGMLQIEVR